MAKIRVVSGDQVGSEYILSDAPIRIGRKSSNTIAIDHPKVSREHATIVMHDSAVVVTDLGSSNGTQVNATQLSAPHTLKDGDEITIGGTVFRFMGDQQEAPKPFVPGYAVGDAIAVGGMGTVYRAIQKSMDREVALKVLHPHFAQREDFVGRFVQEARSAGKLSHPNIIGVHDVGKAGDTYFFTMEMIHGSDLAAIMQNRAVEYPEICRIAAKVTEALDYAHQRGIVHRDIKPDNIMVTSSDQVKLADLGIAKVFEADDSIGEDGKKKVLGTPYYMSPEQARGETVDGRSDLYSLGCTMYHVLAGQPPFDADTNRDIMIKHLTEEPEPITEFVPNLPEEVVNVIHKLMEKDVAARVQTAEEARGLLEAAAQASPRTLPAGVSAAPRRPARTRTPRAQTTANRRVGGRSGKGGMDPATQIGLFAGAILLGLVLLFVFTRSTPPVTTSGGNRFEQSYAEIQRIENRGDWESALKAYASLRSAFADDRNAVARIDTRMAEIRQLMTTLKESDKPEVTVTRNEKAEAAWTEFLTWESRKNGDEVEARERLETLKVAYPPLLDRVSAKLAEYDALAKTADKQVSEDFAELQKQASGVAQSGDYGKVIHALNGFIDAHADAPEADTATALIATLRKQAEEAFANCKTEVDQFLRLREYSRALNRLELFKKQVRYAELNERVDAEMAKTLSSVKKRMGELADAVRAEIRNADFEKASMVLINAQGEFVATEYETAIKHRATAVEILKNTQLQLIGFINAQGAKGGLKTDIPFSANHTSDAMRIIAASDRGIKLELGKLVVLQKWSEIPPEQMMQVFALFLPPDDASRKGMALYAKVFELNN